MTCFVSKPSRITLVGIFFSLSRFCEGNILKSVLRIGWLSTYSRKMVDAHTVCETNGHNPNRKPIRFAQSTMVCVSLFVSHTVCVKHFLKEVAKLTGWFAYCTVG